MPGWTPSRFQVAQAAQIGRVAALALAALVVVACGAEQGSTDSASEIPVTDTGAVATPVPAEPAATPVDDDVSSPTDNSPLEGGRGTSAEPGVALPDAYEIVSNVLLPTETYLPKGDGMPTGVVLLDTRERARNQGLCDALLGEETATVRTETAARRDDPSGDYLVTHWMVRAAVADEGDCPTLLAAYDFERSTRIKTTYGLEGRRGPVVLALDATGEMVFLDLSNASREEVFQATQDWMRLALSAPQSGPNAGRPPRPLGLVAGANALFARLAGGFGTLASADAAPTTFRFNDPTTGAARSFTVYRSGVYLIGATFLL